jgi:rhodanese-related sulfurtransferase
MLRLFKKLTLNQRLAALAIVLGLVAVGATPTRGDRVTVDSRQMMMLVANGADRVSARTLAGWLIEARADFRLVDLRSPAAFAAGPRIPSAENIPVTALLDAGLTRTEKILLVGDDDATVAQAWFLLETQGYKGAYIVEGGMNAWRDQVVYPRVDGLDQAVRAKVEATSAHFGGRPRTGPAGETAAALPASMAQAAPLVPAPAAAAKKPAPAKKKEGC